MRTLSYSTQLIEQDDIEAVVETLQGDFLAQGPKVAQFENALCKYTSSKYAVTFNSATSALQAVYYVCGITNGDEVITTPISFVATSNMFVQLGAIPVWCDVKVDGNIDENKIETLITPKSKAIVVVDFAGNPVNFNKIQKIATKYNLLLIDDASHGLGASFNDKKLGSQADFTIFSFHAIKPITTSEGGAVLTNDKEVATKLQQFRSHGMIKKDLWHSDMQGMGYNLRLTEVAAALGISQLKKLDKFIAQRNKIAQYYNERFKEENLLQTLQIDKNKISSHHLYPILLHSSLYSAKEDIFKKCQAKSIGVQVHYKPIYQNSFYQNKFGFLSLQSADNFYKSELSIPCHQKMNINDAKYVADTFLNIIYEIKGSQ